MPLFERLRHRFSLTPLVAHRIEESYSSLRRTRDVEPDPYSAEALDDLLELNLGRASIQIEPVALLEHEASFLPVQQNFYDPGERIPSYELSQEQHRLHTRARPSVASTSPTPAEVGPAIVTTTNFRGHFADTRLRPRDRDRDRLASGPGRSGKRSLKTLGLKFLNARQHILLALCRDVSLVPCIMGLFQSWWVLMFRVPMRADTLAQVTSARILEHFLTGVWCIVAGYLLHSVLDGLMVRWIVTYSTTGAIVRMLSMSAILIAIEQYLVAAFLAEGFTYGLHTWILISCALTMLYIVQNFVTSNIDLKGKRRARFFDLYNIVVFAVVPVGLASFITMIGVLRSLLILRMDIEQHKQLIS